jgi:hypothetical protein
MTDIGLEIARQSLMPAEEAAKLFGVTENCLARWRSANIGPAYYKLAGRIFYKKEDLQAFIERARVPTEAARQPSTNKETTR